jgi:phosphopantothenoylcysteine synthetase/decarboxylase
MPVLYVVACGARPAADLPPFVTGMRSAGWDVCVIATPDGLKFIDRDRLAALTGHPVRSAYKQPDEPDALPPADAFAVAPATFNTLNKLTSGASDTLALGLLNEAIGFGRPIVVVPAVSGGLARHPAFRTSVETLRSWGISVISAGPPFPWTELTAALLAGRAEGIAWPDIEDPAGRDHA